MALAPTPFESSAGTLLARERADMDAYLSPPVLVARPRLQTMPVIFCSPHSGRVYVPSFLAASRLDALALRRSEDAFVDQLFSCAVDAGAPLLAAQFPRAYLDVNREPGELDPRLIEGPLPRGANTQSARVAGGLGTIPRMVADGDDIYSGRLPVAVALQRIERLYHPFHAALAGLIAETLQAFGVALVVDCHSMPSASISHGAAAGGLSTTSHGPSHRPAPRPHFVIGDRFGTSCTPEVTRTVTQALAGAGYEVAANRPYAGGFITEHYGRPHARVHTIQIEINRALYLRESEMIPSPQFGLLTSVINHLIGALAVMSAAWVRPGRIAAE